MPWARLQWPGPPDPPALGELPGVPGKDYLDIVARPHIPTFRAKAVAPLLFCLLMPAPILLGGLPAVLLVPVPFVWLLLPWQMRREWLAAQAFFASDHVVLRRATGKSAQQIVHLHGLTRITATQNLLQARTGSCTLRFLHANDEDVDAQELAAVHDLELQQAHQVLASYQAALGQTPAEPTPTEATPSIDAGTGSSNWSA